MNDSLTDLHIDTRPIFDIGETPCQAIDAAVASLIPGQNLVITVPFEPIPLYVKLGKLGFTHQTTQIDANTWEVAFRKVTSNQKTLVTR